MGKTHLTPTLSAWPLRGHTALKSIFLETLFLDQLHDFSLLSLNKFLHLFLKTKFMKKISWYRKNYFQSPIHKLWKWHVILEFLRINSNESLQKKTNFQNLENVDDTEIPRSQDLSFKQEIDEPKTESSEIYVHAQYEHSQTSEKTESQFNEIEAELTDKPEENQSPDITDQEGPALLKKSPSNAERDKLKELNARFRRRKLILDRVCALLPTIAEMKRNDTTFEDLLDFHRKIYDMAEKYFLLVI